MSELGRESVSGCCIKILGYFIDFVVIIKVSDNERIVFFNYISIFFIVLF